MRRPSGQFKKTKRRHRENEIPDDDGKNGSEFVHGSINYCTSQLTREMKGVTLATDSAHSSDETFEHFDVGPNARFCFRRFCLRQRDQQ